MSCPYCSFSGARADLHRHLVECHGDRVAVQQAEDQRMYYELSCPYCDFHFRQRVKPRWKDPGFLEEFHREITLVAFDQLLYHLEGAHG